MKPFQWGIIGCGLIAPRFVSDLAKTGEGEVVAAASRSMRRAKRFQQTTGVEHIYNSYEAMLNNHRLDAVYIATSHNFHAENALLCLDRGIPLLIEKPLTQNARQAEQIIAAAREKRLFMMEAMWTRFNPACIKLRELLAAGIIGEVRSMEAEFCIHMNPFSLKMMPWHRMYSPRLAGGALLDLGIYPVTFARMVFGRSPSAITASADMAWTGVDKASRYSFVYPDGATAEMKTSFVEQSTRGLEIFGTKGSIHIPSFHSADHFTIKLTGTAPETVQCEPSGFQHEIREVHRCLEEGLTESPSMPLSETLENIQTLDAIRAQWGMTYPGE